MRPEQNSFTVSPVYMSENNKKVKPITYCYYFDRTLPETRRHTPANEKKRTRKEETRTEFRGDLLYMLLAVVAWCYTNVLFKCLIKHRLTIKPTTFHNIANRLILKFNAR
ncbi:hypothetical protein TDB9533_04211 [Thalassocella blandensis]|nr:hypothetical protein TDB9533_04211 [Thalassocella blandensis]